MSLYIEILEAGELCGRDHELGTHGAAAVEVWLSGSRSGIRTSTHPSFPRPTWKGEVLEVPGVQAGSTLSLRVVDIDPLQPRLSCSSFTFGHVDIQVPDHGTFTGQGVLASARESATAVPGGWLVYERQPLANAPGSQGFLSFRIARQNLTGQDTAHYTNVRRLLEASILAAGAPVEPDFCGVLGLAVGPCPRGGPVGLYRYEASVGACSFRTWRWDGTGGVQWFYVQERDPTLRVYAADEKSQMASGEIRLATTYAGSRGRDSILLEAEPPRLELAWHKRSDISPLRLHYRFFRAEFLRAGTYGFPLFQFTLMATSVGCPLPIQVHVPAGLLAPFSRATGLVAFDLREAGLPMEVCIPDPLRLLGQSLWRLMPSHQVRSSHTKPELDDLNEIPMECLVDVLALELRHGSERTFALPFGSHSIVLRISLLMMDPRLPQPVFGVDRSVVGCSSLGTFSNNALIPPISSRVPRSREIVGVFIHAISVHSPAVSRLFLFGGVGGSGFLDIVALPHCGRLFLSTEASHRGRILIRGLLPEYSVGATAAAVLGDGPQQMHWAFPSPAGDVHACALITAAHWTVNVHDTPVLPVHFQVRLQAEIADTASGLVPVQFVSGSSCAAPKTFGAPRSCDVASAPHSSDRSAEVVEQEGFMAVSCLEENFGSLEVRCGNSTLAIEYFLTDLLWAETSSASLPVLVTSGSESARIEGNAPTERPVAGRFFFLPMELSCHWQAVGRPAPLPDFTEGVLLLQSISVCFMGAPGQEDHVSSCPRRDVSAAKSGWVPAPTVRMRVGRSCAVGRARLWRPCAGVTTWSPVTRGSSVDLVPSIVSTPLTPSGLRADFDIGVQVRWTCEACGAEIVAAAVPQDAHRAVDVHSWRSFVLPMKVVQESPWVEEDPGGTPAFFARFLVCTSRFVKQPSGLLKLGLKPRDPGDSDIQELLRHMTKRQRTSTSSRPLGVGAQDPSNHVSALRLSIDGGPSLLLGKGSRGTEMLFLETNAQHLERVVTVEAVESTGSRLLLASVGLPLLGALGDTETPVSFPLLLRNGVSLMLVASYTPHQALGDVVSPLDEGADQTSSSRDAYDKEKMEDHGWEQKDNLTKEIARLRALVPSVLGMSLQAGPSQQQLPRSHMVAQRRPLSVGGGASPSTSVGAKHATNLRSQSFGGISRSRGMKTHPFLERGTHHWLAPRSAKTAMCSKFWSLEMERVRPAQAKGPFSAGADLGGCAIPGWDEEMNRKCGPQYRAEILGQQRKVVNELHEQLHRMRAEMQRSEARLSRARHLADYAESQLGRATNLSPTPAGVSASAPVVTPSRLHFCSRCSAELFAYDEIHFCSRCAPLVKSELAELQTIVTSLLCQRAQARRELDNLEATYSRLVVERDRLKDQLGSNNDADVIDDRDSTLQLLAKIRTAFASVELAKASDENNLVLLEDREREALSLLEQASEAFAAAAKQREELAKELELADKEFEDLIGTKVGSMAERLPTLAFRNSSVATVGPVAQPLVGSVAPTPGSLLVTFGENEGLASVRSCEGPKGPIPIAPVDDEDLVERLSSEARSRSSSFSFGSDGGRGPQTDSDAGAQAVSGPRVVRNVVQQPHTAIKNERCDTADCIQASHR